MKKHTKKVLGLFGLGAVAGITALAIALPNNPEASAVESTVVDTIQVRVVGSEVDATITAPVDGSVFVSPEQKLSFDYANANTVTASLEYTNRSGNTYSYPGITILTPDYSAGSYEQILNLSNYGIEYPDYDYGYGHYKITVESAGVGGVTDISYTTFDYLPVTGTVEQEKGTNNVKVDLDYDTSDDSNVKNVTITITDEGGNVVVEPIVLDRPATEANFDFGNLGLPDGTYTVTIIANGENGPLYTEYVTKVTFSNINPPIVPVPSTADTGGMFKNNNISQTDYLITGLVIFGIVDIAGVAFIMRNDKKTAKTSKAKSGRRRK